MHAVTGTYHFNSTTLIANRNGYFWKGKQNRIAFCMLRAGISKARNPFILGLFCSFSELIFFDAANEMSNQLDEMNK